MRKRRWILVIALFVTFSALVIYHGWNIIKVNDRIKQYVLSTIQPALGAKCQIEKLDISLGAVHLKNLKVQNNDFSLLVKDVRIGFNFANLVKNNFRPQKIPHDILFVKPHLTLRTNFVKALQKNSSDSSQAEISSYEYWKKIKELNFIKRITISNGKVSYASAINQSEILLTQDINGWLSSKVEGLISARLVGKLFQSSSYNLLINLGFDLIDECLDLMELKINNYELKDNFPFNIGDYFDIKHGTVNSTIMVTNNRSSDKPFDIEGYLSVQYGTIYLYDKRFVFDDIHIKAKIHDQNCTIDSSGFAFNGSYVDIAGKIYNLFAPQFDLKLKSENFDLKQHIHHIKPKSTVELSGYPNFVLHVTNPVKNLKVVGNLSCPKVTINNEIIENISTIISLEGSVFKIKEFSGGFQGLQFAAHGALDLSRKDNNLSFLISGSGQPFGKIKKFPLPSLKNNNNQLQIEGTGSLAHILGIVNYRIASPANSNSIFQFNGNFDVDNKQLSIHLNSPSHLADVKGAVVFSDGNPQYQIKLTDFHNLIYSLPEFKTIKKILNYKTSIINIEGQASEWNIIGKYAWNGTTQRTALLNCRFKFNNDEMKIDATANISSNGEKFQSNLNLIKNTQYWEIVNFNLDNLMHCSGRIDLSEDQPIEANVIFPDASLIELWSFLFGNARSIDQGKFYGFINIGGTLKNPEVLGNFTLSRMVLNQIGLYEGITNFQLIDKKLVLNELTIERDQQPIFQCAGTYTLTHDQLNFDVIGQDIDLNSTITSILNKPGFMEGKGSTRIKLLGNFNRPELYGDIKIENGKIGPFSFNNILLDFGQKHIVPSSTNKSHSDSLTSDGIFLKNILMTRVGQFEMHGQGMIPYSTNQPMAIELAGKGNVLSLLPELTPFFKETRSNGTWSVNFGGRPNNLSVAGGRLKLSDGFLRLAAVAPEIKNIAAEMELEQDGFLNVKFISGKIRGKPFTFRNFRPDSTFLDTTMQAFAIPEYGLNLGIFTLETGLQGIPLHIPALMPKGEIGQFAFKGATDNDHFHFAGPLENPVVSGTIQLQNVNFTFPFIHINSRDSSKTDRVVEVLSRLNWDVTALPGKDSHYQREIPSGVDNVYVDLILDAGVGGLKFNGIIQENTFGVIGTLESSRGHVEYLDLDFQVITAGAEFDMDVTPGANVEFDKSSLLPIVYGEARTTVVDSIGNPYYVYLTLLTTDKVTGHVLKRGRLGEVSFQLSADNPNLGYSEGELLASLGYSTSNMSKVATDIIGISTDNLLFRPLFRPFERQLERTFGLDMIRLSSRFTRNLIEMNLNDERNFQFDSKLFLLRSTKLMVGKYVAQRLFLLYTGQLEAGMNFRYQQEGFGFRHTLGLEYRINPSLLLQMEYDYNSLLLWQKEDKKIMLRHSFPF